MLCFLPSLKRGMGFGWDIDIVEKDKEGKCPWRIAASATPPPPPKNHHHTPPTLLMDWSVLAFPLARLSCNTTPKSRQLTFRNAAEEGAAHGNKSRQRGQAGRPEKPLQRRGGTRTRLHAPVSSIQQRRRETSSFDAVPTQPWRLGGLLVFVRPLEEKKSLGSKKGVSTPALHASSNAENKHGNRHPPLFPARSPLTPRLGRCPSPINKGFFFSQCRFVAANGTDLPRSLAPGASLPTFTDMLKCAACLCHQQQPNEFSVFFCPDAANGSGGQARQKASPSMGGSQGKAWADRSSMVR